MTGSSRSLDLAVIIPQLEKYGGAERVVVECVARWQHRHRITLYAAAISESLLAEHGIGPDAKRVLLAPYFPEPHAMLLNATLLPRLWHDQIGRHDLYHTHLWPTHLIDRHPMVWYPHEPFRSAHDLRYEHRDAGNGDSSVHMYPKLNYDRLPNDLYAPYLRAINGADKSVAPDVIVANSRYTASYLEQVYGRPVTDVVYPGAEAARVSGLPRDKNLFVTISQLWSHKRTRLLIEAVSHTDEAQLLVIGSGPDQAWLEEMAASLGVKDRVFFLAGLRNDEMELILARACAFLFAPIREPFGIVVLEAMAAGLPILAANEGGYTEVCSAENAFLVPATPTAFAEKMVLLQRDQALRDRMGEAGKSLAASYTWSRTAEELETLLLDAAPPLASQEEIAFPQSRTLVGAQYYLWYGEGYGAAHWNDSAVSGYVSDAPRIGYYGSAKGTTISAHLEMATQMGLDFLVANLHLDERGINPIEWSGLRALFEGSETDRHGIRIAVQLVPYTDDIGAITKAITQIEELYAGLASYLHLDGRPVLFWFWTGGFDRHVELARLRETASAFTNIAVALRLPAGPDEQQLSANLFEGFAPYSPLELASAEERRDVWSLGYRLAAEAGMAWRVATISPGYDDAGLLDARRMGNTRRTVPRNDGDTYSEAIGWVEQLEHAPHLVLISTFNEFHENTHIEPSAKLGNRYAEMTGRFTAALRKAAGEADD